MQQCNFHVLAAQRATDHVSRTAHHLTTTAISWCLSRHGRLLSLWWCHMGWTEPSSIWSMGTWVKVGWIDGEKMWNACSGLSTCLWWLNVVINVALVVMICRINWIDHASDMSRDKPTMDRNVVWCWSGQNQRWRWLILVWISTVCKVLWCLAVGLLQTTVICHVMVPCEICCKASVIRSCDSTTWNTLQYTGEGLLVAWHWLVNLQLWWFAEGLCCSCTTACQGNSVAALSVIKWNTTTWTSIECASETLKGTSKWCRILFCGCGLNFYPKRNQFKLTNTFTILLVSKKGSAVATTVKKFKIEHPLQYLNCFVDP